MSRQAVIAAWGRWASHFPNEFRNVTAEESAARLASYIDLLEDIPDDIMAIVALKVLTLYDWFPTTNQIRRCAVSLVNPSRMSAAEAWAIVQRRLSKSGARGLRDIDDPLIAATVEVIGVDRLRHNDNEAALFAQFRDTYDTLRARQTEMLQTPRKVHDMLAAVVERQRLEGGQHARQIRPPDEGRT
jgi:hypothetical protein